ncbi:transporter substrate-binding domain-containing protein [Pseudothauera rhizosphaerae]|uniref:Transporter substrate-binding domain-containing protein n=1 Tax=Pseudothauera rhizosphaerae TaxID=2565932 RepID=A0A4S4AUW8_9RHOO|nr:transporter substrate-binding domain-containing protein [Pseudothauera rhizosphaerae]THF63330.1 transporter substrate-binding domain-containing protein [Pseudothauera rhizosphaerae]
MPKQRRNFLRSLFAGAALFACATLPVQADVLADIQRNGTLRVAVPQDFPPFGSVGTDLKPQGYDIDMASLIAKELGVKVELIPVSSTNRIPFLTTGKADLVISSLGKNAEREKVIDFSDAYAPFFNGVFGPADAAVSAVGDLDGKTVGVTRGAVEDLELSKIASPKVTIKRFEDNNATISAYLTGQVQFIATGNVVAAAVNDMTKLRGLSAKFLIKNSPCYVGVAKGEAALLARVNAVIAKAKADGSLEQIAQRWLKAPLPTDL